MRKLNRNSSIFSDRSESLVLENQIKGEQIINTYRVTILAAISVLVLSMITNNRTVTLSDIANIVSIIAALVFTALSATLLHYRIYSVRLTYVATTIDMFLISSSLFFSQYAPNSSVATIVHSGSFALYFPIIIFSLRRHNPVNTFLTGILAAISYFALIIYIGNHHAFDSVLFASSGLRMKNDMINEMVKVLGLGASGFAGYNIAKNHEDLFSKGLQSEKEKERLKTTFGRYISSEVVEKILSKKVTTTGETREATVMFLNIKDFTSLAERVDAQHIVLILNIFYAYMIDIIHKHDGFINKFIGDAIMVVFGAPIHYENHREKAFACAIEMHKKLGEINEKLGDITNEWKLGFGIGINTGDIILGSVGNNIRTEYTALGDTVNLASRFERLTRIYNTPIILGESAYTDAFSPYVSEPLSVDVKGKSTRTLVYQVMENCIP